jgi:DNA-binding NarL/FixJ family response regulator
MKNEINVLIVDDHFFLRESLMMLLKTVEAIVFNVQDADSGEAAIEKVRNNDFDIILMDYHLGLGISGPEAIRRILKIKPGIKVLGLSSNSETALINAMIDAGANGYLLKDLEKKELVQAIKAVLAGKIYYCKRIRAKLDLE